MHACGRVLFHGRICVLSDAGHQYCGDAQTLDAGSYRQEMHCVSHGGSRQIDDLQKLWCTHLPGVRARYGQDGHRATANHHSPAKNQCPLYRLPSWVCCKCVQTDIMRSSGFCGFVVCIFSVCDSPSTLSRLSGLSSVSRTSSSLVVSRSAIAHGLSQTKLIAVLCRLGVSQETMSSWQEWMLAATGHSDRMLVHPKYRLSADSAVSIRRRHIQVD